MRVAIPKFATKSEAAFYLRTNIKTIVQQKKSMPIKSDVLEWGCLPVNEKQLLKEDGSALGVDEIEVNLERAASCGDRGSAVIESLRKC